MHWLLLSSSESYKYSLTICNYTFICKGTHNSILFLHFFVHYAKPDEAGHKAGECEGTEESVSHTEVDEVGREHSEEFIP